MNAPAAISRAPALVAVLLCGAAGCASSPAVPPAPQSPVAAVAAVSTPDVQTPKSDVAASRPVVVSPSKEGAMGAIVIDDMPSDSAELYEDDVPMTYDVGESKPIGAGTHIVSLVVATKTVWMSKINVAAGTTVHVHIPPKYLTAYQ